MPHKRHSKKWWIEEVGMWAVFIFFGVGIYVLVRMDPDGVQQMLGCK